MIGFLIGAVCLVGLVKMIRRGRRHGRFGYGGCHHGYGGCGGGRDSGYRGRHDRYDGDDFGAPPWARDAFERHPWFLMGLFRRIDATPGQEKVIKEAVKEMREAGYALRGELKQSRSDLGKAARSESFDEVLFGEMFARHDSAMEAFRKAAMTAFAKVHAALDERQRAQLADLVEHGPGSFRGRRWGGGRDSTYV